MGWPKKNEECRLYFERKAKTYLLVWQGKDFQLHDGSQEAVGELMIYNDPESPKLCTTSVSPVHLYKKCRRASWQEMPEVWQKALGEYLTDDPRTYRGLFRKEELECRFCGEPKGETVICDVCNKKMSA